MNHDFARDLRKSMTDAERRLWLELKARRFDGRKFRRQVPIGSYIVDFVCFACFASKLVVELDGASMPPRSNGTRPARPG